MTERICGKTTGNISGKPAGNISGETFGRSGDSFHGGRTYQGQREYAGIDQFRLAAAVMVIAIHTAPFSGVSDSLDFLLTYCAGRVAVPFFLMVTGYFVLGSWKAGGCADDSRVIRFLKKTMFLYAVSVVLYLPVNFYSGSMPDSAGEFFRMLFFDGTFYHLWYFPAVLLGCVIVMQLQKRFPAGAVLAVSAVLYLIGAGGDSYFGLISRIPGAETFYSVLFAVSSYTRNGAFFAPLFLVMGMLLRESSGRRKQKTRGRRTQEAGSAYLAAGLIFAGALMLAEGYATYYFGLQRHNSMYLFLIPVIYLLFQLLLRVPGRAPGWARDISMIVYIIHPAVLIALRGAAQAVGLTGLLVENALVQFLSVTLGSFVLAWLTDRLYTRLKSRKEAHENG